MAEQAELDPNNPTDFAEIMRQKEGGSTEPESQDAAVASEEGVAADDGAASAEEGASSSDGEGEDRFQAGYAKALGEQSEKLGAERQAREALEARLAELEKADSDDGTLPEQTFGTPDEEAEIESMIEELGGHVAIGRIVESKPHLFDAALDIWYESDPRAARRYERQYNQILESYEEQAAQGEQQAGPVVDPTLAEIKAERAQQAAQNTIRAEYGEDRLKAVTPHLEEALKAAPKRIQGVVAEDLASGDTERVADALRTVIALAEPRVGTDATRVAAEQRAAAQRTAKQRANVATGSAKVAGGPSGEMSAEEFQALSPDERSVAAAKIMKERLLRTTTSMSAGLESNKPAA